MAENDMPKTIPMMTSPNYKKRFIAEYVQTKIRYEKLHAMLVKYEAGTLDFTPDCSLSLLREQADYMGRYLHCLEIRAQIEKVELPGWSINWPCDVSCGSQANNSDNR